MAGRFKSIWNEKRPARSSATGPAIAGAATDAESGAGDDTTRSALRALRIMLDRGLMTPQEYEERRRALQGGPAGDETH